MGLASGTVSCCRKFDGNRVNIKRGAGGSTPYTELEPHHLYHIVNKKRAVCIRRPPPSSRRQERYFFSASFVFADCSAAVFEIL
jgi:hypothetical protein